MKTLHRLPYDGAIDADGHLMEPPDLWERYIDPKYRDRAMKVRKDDGGFEYLELDGKPSKLIGKGMLAATGFMDRVGGIVYERETRTGFKYIDDAPLGGMDPKERIMRIDQENLDAVVLYPTLGVLWIAECEDEALTQAYIRAYNRFIVEFCADSKDRLVPVAQLSLGDPETAEAELYRAAEDGVKGAWVPPFTHTRKPLGDPIHDSVFAALEELRLPLGIHPSFEPKWAGPGRFGPYTSGQYSFSINVTAPDAVRHAFTSLFQYGTLEKFPRLNIVILESGAGWISYWLDRMDAVYRSPQGRKVRALMAEPPSYYFKRQCYISGDPDETGLAPIITHVGQDRFFWASDFPHPDHPPNYIPELTRLVRQLPESARLPFLGGNVSRLYDIKVT